MKLEFTETGSTPLACPAWSDEAPAKLGKHTASKQAGRQAGRQAGSLMMTEPVTGGSWRLAGQGRQSLSTA